MPSERVFSTENPEVIALVELALREDTGSGDITTNAIFSGTERATARIIAKSEGIVSGIDVARLVTSKTDKSLVFRNFTDDGQRASVNETILDISGNAASILTAERTILNFLQRMSGIATETNRYVEAIAHTRARILDTRKTIPGNRVLDKWAVKTGGGLNHRMRLDDMFLIKENHVTVAGGIIEAVHRCSEFRRKHGLNARIEIEVRNLEELNLALGTSECDYMLLDNMSNEKMREAVKITAGRARLEASGNMTLDRITEVAETGVDFISVGVLTHSSRALDLSMIFDP